MDLYIMANHSSSETHQKETEYIQEGTVTY